MILGDIIKQYRSDNHLSMDKFASLSGLTKGYISMLEKNEHPKTKKALLPTMETIEKVAKGMAIDPQQLVKKLDKEQAIGVTLTPETYLKLMESRFISREVLELENKLEADYYKDWITFGYKKVTAMEKEATNVLTLDDYRQTVDISVPGRVSAGTGYWQEDDLCELFSFPIDSIPDESDYDTVAQVFGDSMAPHINDKDYLFIRLQSHLDLNTIGIVSINGENYVKKFKGTYFQSLNSSYPDILIQPEDQIRIIGKVVSVYSSKSV